MSNQDQEEMNGIRLASRVLTPPPLHKGLIFGLAKAISFVSMKNKIRSLLCLTAAGLLINFNLMADTDPTDPNPY